MASLAHRGRGRWQVGWRLAVGACALAAAAAGAEPKIETVRVSFELRALQNPPQAETFDVPVRYLPATCRESIALLEARASITIRQEESKDGGAIVSIDPNVECTLRKMQSGALPAPTVAIVEKTPSQAKELVVPFATAASEPSWSGANVTAKAALTTPDLVSARFWREVQVRCGAPAPGGGT